MAEQTGTYGAEVMARLLNITPRWLQKLAKDGVIVPPVNGQYALAPTVQGYIKHLQDIIARRGKPAMDDSRMRVLSERERHLKIANDKEEGTLVARTEDEAVMDEIAALLNHALDAVPGRLANDITTQLAGENNPAVIRAWLKDEIRTIRTGIVARLTSMAIADKAGRRPAAKATPKPRPVGRRAAGAAGGQRGARAVAEP